MTFVSDLQPRALWRHFDKILTIPRGSKNEDKIAAYILEVAARCNLESKQDASGNVVVRKPAAPGCENVPVTILQSHLDMVNEKNTDVEHDFERDPIKPREVDGYLYATGTTLGSDNGIGVAAALAIMDSDGLKHGPLELLFTVDEETGLTGASSLAGDMLEGRRLINMDTEEEGALYVGCAGGAGVNITLDLNYAEPTNDSFVEVKLVGLKGGHSGVDIHVQRGNAVKLLARALNHAASSVSFELASLTGGNMHNAIPREAFALLAVSDLSGLKAILEKSYSSIKAEFKPVEPDMVIEINEVESRKVFDANTARTVLNLVNSLPHGVMSMSYDIPDLVETSANLASVKIEAEKMTLHQSTRSSVDSAIVAIQERILSIGRLAGAGVEETEGYPGWKPDLSSQVLQVAKEIHVSALGTEPEVKAIHAGLECGIIGEKYPGMDMVSFGPQIEFPHSPDERVRIGSVADFYKLLCGVLERLTSA